MADMTIIQIEHFLIIHAHSCAPLSSKLLLTPQHWITFIHCVRARTTQIVPNIYTLYELVRMNMELFFRLFFKLLLFFLKKKNENEFVNEKKYER